MRKSLKKHSNISTFKNFASWNSNLGKWVPTWEILKAQIRNSTIQLAKIFASCESTSRNMCVISQVQNPFLQPVNQLVNQVAKLGNLWIPGNLRKCQPSFKFLFKPLMSSIFILHSHSKLRKALSSWETQKSRAFPPLEALRSCVWRESTSAHPTRTLWNTSQAIPLHFSHGQDKKSPSRVSIS